MKTVSNKTLFRSMTKKNPEAKKVLFYLTSYKFPWWVYQVPINYFHRHGYEVVVYEFQDEIIENDNPDILPSTTLALIEDISSKQEDYKSHGIEIFHGIGNSLGSFFLYNYVVRHSLDAIVLNGGGSIAEIIFGGKNGSWQKVAHTYKSLGYTKDKLINHWIEFDTPKFAASIKINRLLMFYSEKDGTIPLSTTRAFIDAIKSSGKQITVISDDSTHVLSVIKNAHKLNYTYNFLNNKENT